MLEVVQHEQRPFVSSKGFPDLTQRLHVRGRAGQTQHPGQRAREQTSIGQFGQRDEPGRAPEERRRGPRRLDGEPRLARPARPDQRQQARFGRAQQRAEAGHLRFPTEEAREQRRSDEETDGTWAAFSARSGGKVSRGMSRVRDLEQALRHGHVAQPPGAQSTSRTPPARSWGSRAAVASEQRIWPPCAAATMREAGAAPGSGNHSPPAPRRRCAAPCARAGRRPRSRVAMARP
jgi:hypothetical protein